MRRHGLFIIALYLAVPAVIHLRTLVAVPADGRRLSVLPSVDWTAAQPGGSPSSGAAAADSLWQRRLDVEKLNSSIQRMPGIRNLRQWGKSLRVALGQEMPFIYEQRKREPMMFLTSEIQVARGLTDAARAAALDGAAGAARRQETLAKQGWQLVMVPVPSKLSIYRDWVQWPLAGENLIDRSDVAEDRTDEIADLFFQRLAELAVPAIDLRPQFRAWTAEHGCSMYLYPRGESHWSGYGIELAARQVSALLVDRFGVPPFTGRQTYGTFDIAADMGLTYDVDPRFPSRLASLIRFSDRLIVGREESSAAPPQPRFLIVVAGTSYSGQYWASIPGVRGDFPFVLSQFLTQVEVQNRARAGRGSYESFAIFQQEADRIAAQFEHRHHLPPGSYQKIVVWEFPFRNLRQMAVETNR